MPSIYILKLQNNKYYVGRSDNVDKRIAEHFNRTGCEFTKKYYPIDIYKVIDNASVFDEDKYVKEYMIKFGIDNVRGGSYSNEHLDPAQLIMIKKEIWNSTNCCNKCGKNTHFAKDCKELYDAFGDKIEGWCYVCEHCEKEFINKEECKQHEKNCKVKYKKNNLNCYTCGKFGHFATDCYLNKKNIYTKNSKCYSCGKYGHYSSNCYSNKKKYYYDSDSD